MNWTLRSCKGTKAIRGTLAEAIEAAKTMQDELQAAFGVDVENAWGDTVYTAE